MDEKVERDFQLPCGFCRAYNRAERTFCVRCRRRIIPLTKYDITEKDFVYQPDEDHLEVLQDTEPLPHIINQMVSKPRERALRAKLIETGQRVGPFSRLGWLIANCAETLGLEIIPETFVVPSGQINAAVFGSDQNPVLMITTGALQLKEVEVGALLGHELGHVKSKHMLYHTLAESLGRGTQLLASYYGAGLISLPIEMALLGWHRESEVTADRAALIIVENPEAFQSLMVKLAWPAGLTVTGDSFSEVLQTHPTHGNRLMMVRQFYASPQFKRAYEKVKLRSRVKGALLPVCRFCGQAKPVTALYCDVCGRSQI